MILGHAHPDVIEAIAAAAKNGTSYGAPTELEVAFAEKVHRALPVDRDDARRLERHRGLHGGASARRAASPVATAIVKFEGCYHGHADFLLVKAGSGALTFGVPDSAGVPAATAKAHAHAPVQRHRGARRSSSPRAARRSPRSSSSRSSATWACVPPEPGFLEAIIDAVQGARRGLDLRRGHDRLPRRARRHAGARRPRAPT